MKTLQQPTNSIFISGIGTEIGKTVVSAIFCQALGYDYWKPIQSGELEQSDSIEVRQLVSEKCTIHPETYRLKTPISPHASARKDGIEIDISKIVAPKIEKRLIIEGAGGLLVPVNQKNTIADIIEQLGAQVILVCDHYLGSINHTLLSLAEIHRRELPLAGVVFNGESNLDSESIIEKMGQCNQVFRIPRLQNIDRKSIEAQANLFKPQLKRLPNF